MYDDILVPVDGSEHAIAAIRQALGLAETSRATVHGLSVAFVVSALIGSIALYCAFNIQRFAIARDGSSEIPDPATD
ncbi:universal stress protein [Saliphagus sp. LR7]|uniref:universal stress protein n=1 Tax=Saliphagus sp. LR7 TaxID=2282654 RepID=UPI000DF72182|nr:universal stress protein [Saliphagus sp. LR7]